MRSISGFFCQFKRTSHRQWTLLLSAILIFSLSAIVAHAQEPVAALPQVYIDTTWNPPTEGTTWAAHNAVQFTKALANSSPGDVIVLDAGVTYSGNFVLPNKNNPNNQWIYIISSALANLPEEPA